MQGVFHILDNLRMKKKLPLNAVSILSLFVIIILSACKHESTECKALITVVTSVNNSNGVETPVADATVIISIDTSKTSSATGVRDPSFPKTKNTGSNGQVEFSFPNGIVVNIYSYKVIAPLDTIKNKTFVAINPSTTEEKRVVLKR